MFISESNEFFLENLNEQKKETIFTQNSISETWIDIFEPTLFGNDAL